MNVQKGENEVVNHGEIMRPVEYSEQVITKNYNAPDKEIYYQPILERKIVN